MTVTENSRQTAKLVWALALLALPADAQRTYVERIGTAPLADELAMALGDALAYWNGHAREDEIPKQLVTAAREIERTLSLADGAVDSNFWDVENLETHPTWLAVREAARECLFDIDKL